MRGCCWATPQAGVRRGGTTEAACGVVARRDAWDAGGVVQSERSDEVVRDRDLDRHDAAFADDVERPQRRVTWQQVLGLVVATAALMLVIAGVVGLVAGVSARLADGDAADAVLAFVAQGVALVLVSLVVGIGALWLLVRGERRWWRSQGASSRQPTAETTAHIAGS